MESVFLTFGLRKRIDWSVLENQVSAPLFSTPGPSATPAVTLQQNGCMKFQSLGCGVLNFDQATNHLPLSEFNRFNPVLIPTRRQVYFVRTKRTSFHDWKAFSV
jgi:hypothetical protein